MGLRHTSFPFSSSGGLLPLRNTWCGRKKLKERLSILPDPGSNGLVITLQGKSRFNDKNVLILYYLMLLVCLCTWTRFGFCVWKKSGHKSTSQLIKLGMGSFFISIVAAVSTSLSGWVSMTLTINDTEIKMQNNFFTRRYSVSDVTMIRATHNQLMMTAVTTTTRGASAPRKNLLLPGMYLREAQEVTRSIQRHPGLPQIQAKLIDEATKLTRLPRRALLARYFYWAILYAVMVFSLSSILKDIYYRDIRNVTNSLF